MVTKNDVSARLKSQLAKLYIDFITEQYSIMNSSEYSGMGQGDVIKTLHH